MSEHVSDEQLSLLIDGELSLAAREAVIAHVRVCPGCAARHDRLVDLSALLRMQPAAGWSDEQTELTLRRIRASRVGQRRLRDASRDWTLAFAAALAAAGAVASVLLVPLVSGDPVRTLSALLPGSVLLGSGHLLPALAAVAVLGLAAFPLSRSR